MKLNSLLIAVLCMYSLAGCTKKIIIEREIEKIIKQPAEIIYVDKDSKPEYDPETKSMAAEAISQALGMMNEVLQLGGNITESQYSVDKAQYYFDAGFYDESLSLAEHGYRIAYDSLEYFDNEEAPAIIKSGHYLVGTWAADKDCLWNISLSQYGTPDRWNDIYLSNRHQIENPDLIYPNQTLRIPE